MSSKAELFTQINILCEEIELLFDKNGLATLDHKLKNRQELLEELMSNYSSDLDESELDLLHKIHDQVQLDIERMSELFKEKEKEILQRKRSGKRMNLYTTIARQK